MALIFCDGFDHYATADFLQKWDISTGQLPDVTTGGRFGGNKFWAGGTNAIQQVVKIVPSYPTYIAGFAMNLSNYTTPLSLVEFRDQTTVQCKLIWDLSSGYLHAYTAGSTDRGVCSSYISYNGVWRYFEIKVTIHDSAGAIEVRENGVTMLSLSGIDTQASGNAIIDRVALGGAPGTSYMNLSLDDFYLCDDQGSFSNTFLGDIRVQSILPSAAGNTTQMTPSAGSNYQCVDEAVPNGDTDYVSETTAGEKDTYAFGNLTPTSGTIAGVQVMINARKDDAGSRSIAPVYRPVSTDYDGTTVIVSDSYTYYREIAEVSPATSAAWTIAEINGAEFGVKLIS
jgi:hypothetical protein